MKFLPSFGVLFSGGFSLWVYVMWVKVCVQWCVWHYKNTGVTHHITPCGFLSSHLQSQWVISGAKFTCQKWRGTWPGVSAVSGVRVRKSCVSAKTDEMSTVQRLARSLTPSLSP